jgi:hypothetical protein
MNCLKNLWKADCEENWKMRQVSDLGAFSGLNKRLISRYVLPPSRQNDDQMQRLSQFGSHS